MVLPRLTVLNGRYAIGRVLHAPGALVASYQAWNLHTEDQVVIEEYFPVSLARRKEGSLRIDAVDAPQEELFRYGREQFLREASVLSSIDHPSLVRTLDHFEEHNTAYRVLDHHKGATLDSVLEQQGGKLALRTAITILVPLLEGLHAVHQHGLLHGAISPEAAFLAKSQGALLRGFRTAQIMLAQRAGERNHLMDGYAAPEQYETDGHQGPWTDVYGSGALLYRVLTGNVLPAATRRQQRDEVPVLLAQAGDLSEALRGVFTEALSLDSTNRLRSVQAFQQRLLDAMQGNEDAFSRTASVTGVETPQAPEAQPSSTHDSVAVEEEWPAPAELETTPTLIEYDIEPVVPVQPTATTVEEELAALAQQEIDALAEQEKAERESQERAVQDKQKKAEAKKEKRAAKDKAAKSKRGAKPRKQKKSASPPRHTADRTPRPGKKKPVPVLAAIAVVVVVALSGTFALMQGSGSEVSQFAHFKANGDSLFAMASYVEAKAQYENALAVNPKDKYVTNRLSETQLLLSEESKSAYYRSLAEGDSLYALADSLLAEGQTLQALSHYTESNRTYFEALRYRPDDPILLEKGRLTSEAMDRALQSNIAQAGQQSADEAEQDPEAARQQLYTTYRQQGDAMFERGDFLTAQERYTRALTYVPEDPYVSAKLQEIQETLAEADLEQQARQFITQGNSFSDQGRYAEAKVAYQRALDTQPGIEEALNGIVMADSMLSALQKEEEQYQYHRGQGDMLVAQNNLEAALASYEVALTFKPYDTELQRQIQEVQQTLDTRQQEQMLKDSMVEDGIYKVVEEAPELIGGLVALHRKVRVPEAAARAGISGRVYVQFIIDEEGRVHDPVVVRGIGGGCDEEAVRVIKRARFTPGKVEGQPVKMRHTLFIAFPKANREP